MARSKRRNPYYLPHLNPSTRRVARARQPVAPEVCPPRSTACRQRPKHNFAKSFASIKEARAFLEFKVPEMSDAECAQNADLIRQAEKMVKRADRRNQKRKIKKLTSPLRAGGAVTRPPKVRTYYEEVSGPKGEVIRFKLVFQDGQFVKRLRVSEDPPVGSIILDLTSGIKAWKRHSDKRRSIPVTSEMLRTYQNSFLFLIRRLAAGRINLNEFINLVNQKKREKKSGPFKKLRRKNQKNR